MTWLEPPRQAFIESGDIRIRVEIIRFASSGVLVAAAQPFGFVPRQRVRLNFVGEAGAIGVFANVVSEGEPGLSLQIDAETDAIMRHVLERWSSGEAASFGAFRTAISHEAPTPDLTAAASGAGALGAAISVETPTPDLTQAVPRDPADGYLVTLDLPGRRGSPPRDRLPRSVRTPLPWSARTPLPRSARTPAAALLDPPHLESTDAARSGRSVLLVEDDRLVARSLAAGLAHDGVSVLHAEDGLTALSLLDEHAIDVVLLDWFLPRLSGEQVLAAIRQSALEVPVAIVSGAVDGGAMEHQALRLGADRVFPKPYRLAQIAEWLRCVLPPQPASE